MPRLFVAIWPSTDVCQALGRLPPVDAPELRPVSPANWHITLRFLGDVPDIDVAAVIEAIDSAPLAPTTARFGPEVVWLDRRQLVIPVAGVDALAAAVHDATGGFGIRIDRPFVGHLTVARSRRRVDTALVGTTVDASQAVDEVALVRSDLDERGATYTTIHRRSLH